MSGNVRNVLHIPLSCYKSIGYNLRCHTKFTRLHTTSCDHKAPNMLNSRPLLPSVRHTHSNKQYRYFRVEIHKKWDEPFAHRTKCRSDPRVPRLLFLNLWKLVYQATLINCPNSIHTYVFTPPFEVR